MNTKHLATLLAISDSRSLAAAGRLLGIASATVAEHVELLERDLRAQLVERSGRRVVLSAAGRAIIDEVRDLVTRMDNIRDIARLGELKGVLRVGSISTALTSFVPPGVEEFSRLHPGIDLVLKPAATDDLFKMIEFGQLDCAITSLPPFALPKSYSWLPIVSQPLALLVPERFPGEKIEDFVGKYPLIRMDAKSWTGQIVTSYLSERGLLFDILFESSAQHLMILFVSRGLGVSLLPDTGFAGMSVDHVRKILVGDERHVRHVGLLCAPNAPASIVQAFANTLRSIANPERIVDVTWPASRA